MLTYPNVPGYKERETSKEAAERVAGRAAALRRIVLTTLRDWGGGLTADEIAALLDESVLSIRPRVSELARDGLIRKTGERRRNQSGMQAHVWIASTRAAA